MVGGQEWVGEFLSDRIFSFMKSKKYASVSVNLSGN